ncbi:anti-sigma-I factor RsgI2-like [Clupea harengus]|uniref:Anti-sigma-I factor RsgI2-like n=1 Tax=Clupea harengus TaxID=7950 RepID=A0A6P8GSJ4_CLUHA|nr:anti-sigma-I factor RsgI2-like [Clupea harengus]
MEEREPSPSSQKEVLIIPLHPNVTPPSPAHQTSCPSSSQTTSTSTVSSPKGPAGSQLFAELLESHARRIPRTASPERVTTPPQQTTPQHVTTPSNVATPSPVATPSRVAAPQSPSLSPTPTTSPKEQGARSLSSPELLKELKQPHPLKHVSAHKGLTTVFSGRGKTPSPSTTTSHGGEKPQGLSNGMKH